MKHTQIQMVWDNVRFNPPKENLWYRGVDKGKVYHSSIRMGDNTLSIAYFTSDSVPEGWSATVYDGNKIVSYRDLGHNPIVARDVADAENQALKWMKSL